MANKILEILDEKPDEPKYTVESLIAIEKDFGKIPTNLTNEDGTFRYSELVKMFWYLLKQEGDIITEEELAKKINTGNIVQVMRAIRIALTPNIPKELMDSIVAETKPADTIPEVKPGGDSEKKQ